MKQNGKLNRVMANRNHLKKLVVFFIAIFASVGVWGQSTFIIEGLIWGNSEMPAKFAFNLETKDLINTVQLDGESMRVKCKIEHMSTIVDGNKKLVRFYLSDCPAWCDVVLIQKDMISWGIVDKIELDGTFTGMEDLTSQGLPFDFDKLYNEVKKYEKPTTSTTPKTQPQTTTTTTPKTQPQTTSTAASAEYVELRGVKWATCNVGSRGTFVLQPHHAGNLYTCSEAQSACPAGWRLPTRDEISDLADMGGHTLTTLNGVTGKEFGFVVITIGGDGGSERNMIFLPAAGTRSSSDGNASVRGGYWSSSVWGNGYYGDCLTFNNISGYASVGGTPCTDGRSVRCVKR